MAKRLVIIESPYRGEVDKHLQYARACVNHALRIGEAPIASHLLYTQHGILDDNNEPDRLLGMASGWAWYQVAHACVVYTDLGITSGMIEGMNQATNYRVQIDYRRLGDKWQRESR